MRELLAALLRHRIFVCLAILALAGVSLLWRPGYLKAQAQLYPQSCLGGWDTPQLAAGAPDLGEDSSVALFSHANSAAITNALAQLYCGTFSGEVPEGTVP